MWSLRVVINFNIRSKKQQQDFVLVSANFLQAELIQRKKFRYQSYC